MLFQPAIIALLLASAVSVALLVAAAPFAWQILRYWDIHSGSELQLRLERRTYLMSTLLSFVFITQLFALLLFVFNADKMAVMFVGAMCAVGTLNANEYGFPALFAQIVVFFLAAAWLVVNHADTRAFDYPLVRVKYLLLLGILPFVALTFALQLQYFLNLKADVITSCCGSLFSGEAKTLSGDAAALPPLQAMMLSYGALALVVAAALFHVRRQRGGYLVAGLSGLAFVAAMAGIVSFVSLYVYEHPHHHCPFCLLKPEYDLQGYWLYLPLFIATAAGLGVGALQPFRRIPSLAIIAPQIAHSLSWIAALGFTLFTLVATFMIRNSNLILFEG
jgi:MYXO-CTERM domain-containing protein